VTEDAGGGAWAREGRGSVAGDTGRKHRWEVTADVPPLRRPWAEALAEGEEDLPLFKEGEA
jgi:hypothetical protein